MARSATRRGIVVDYRVEGEFPTYGNDDDRVDEIAVDLVHRFMEKVRRHPTYRNAVHTQSVLTITSNVVYGKHTGNTPCGRRAGDPFAPGANPMNGRDTHGMVAAALSVAKIPYEDAEDGISLTTTVTPDGLGRTQDERVGNLVGVLDGYVAEGGFHMNVNVLDRKTLEDAMKHPEKLPAAHHPRVGLRGQLRPPHPGAAAGRHQPHVPRERLAVPHAHARAAAAAPGTARDGRVHSWDVSTGVDGPGTRLVVFLAGCPLRCLYCQNPDTWHMRDGRHCGVADIERRMRRYARFVTTAGGGVTVSGGEPLLQPAFTRDVFEAAKRLGLHTALDTQGSSGARADDRLLAATDLVLLDIKAGSEDTCQRLTGGALAPALAFADRLAELGTPVWVRYVLVPGWTDAPEEIEAVADRCAALANVERVDVLAVPQLGRSKYERLGLQPPLADTPAPTRDQLDGGPGRVRGPRARRLVAALTGCSRAAAGLHSRATSARMWAISPACAGCEAMFCSS